MQGKQFFEDIITEQKMEATRLFAGGVAHDLNNLLNAILGNISLAQIFAPPGDKCHKYLDATEKACLQARDFSELLLSISRGEPLEKEIISASDLIHKAEEFIPADSQVKCVFLIPENLWTVDGDEVQLGRVLQYIVINACQAMPKEGTLTISGDNAEIDEPNTLAVPAGKFLRLSFFDQGKGIPREHLSKIFDPYFLNKGRRCGLFLTIAYSIVKKHGGTINVASEEGKGTCFSVYLPAAQSFVKELAETTSCARVLIMDDEEIIREIVAEMLSFIGYETASAGDGREAIKLYVKAKEEGNPFDALLIDLNIAGGMGGREAVRRLKAIDPDVKAIVSSGFTNDPIMINYKEYGFCDVVPKPYKMQELNRAFDKILKDKKA